MATANLDTDCKLVEDSQEGRYDCPVCLQILRDPYMSLCCRNNFCHACFTKLRNAGDPCPLCRNSEFRTNRNTLLCLTVDHLQVYCAHKAKGCQWVGDFGDYEVHLNQRPVLRYQANGCPFVKVSCQYCSKSFQRGQICAHVGTCPRRPFMCEYCQSYDSFYEEVSSIHWPVCRYYPVLCPNGCNEHVARQSLRRHIAKNCSMTVIECDFKLFGCTAKLSRKDIWKPM